MTRALLSTLVLLLAAPAAASEATASPEASARREQLRMATEALSRGEPDVAFSHASACVERTLVHSECLLIGARALAAKKERWRAEAWLDRAQAAGAAWSLCFPEKKKIDALPRDPASPLDSDPATQLAEAKQALEKKRHVEAAALLSRCSTGSDATAAGCNLLMGSTLAKFGDVRQASKHYERFVKLSPDSPEAPHVKKLLEEYRASGGR